jgi:hypothetical protein
MSQYTQTVEVGENVYEFDDLDIGQVFTIADDVNQEIFIKSSYLQGLEINGSRYDFPANRQVRKVSFGEVIK